MRAISMLPVLLAALGLAVGCGGDDETTTTTTGTSASGNEECAVVEPPAPRETEATASPGEPLDDATTYTLNFETSCGSFAVQLDTELAPNTAPSLVALAEDGFFDDTVIHRVVPNFVIQGGDPTQTGAGGPGYSTVDVPPSDAAYTKGVVAMAKSGNEPPGTAGSQFFVVSGADAGLPPEYAIVGEVTAGLDTIARINALGEGDGPPSLPVVVESVTVTES